MKPSRIALYSLALSFSAFLAIPALDYAVDFYVYYYGTPGIQMGYSAEVHYTFIFRSSAMIIGWLFFIVFLIISLATFFTKLEDAIKSASQSKPKP